jgi:hypothetical protein
VAVVQPGWARSCQLTSRRIRVTSTRSCVRCTTHYVCHSSQRPNNEQNQPRFNVAVHCPTCSMATRFFDRATIEIHGNTNQPFQNATRTNMRCIVGLLMVCEHST